MSDVPAWLAIATGGIGIVGGLGVEGLRGRLELKKLRESGAQEQRRLRDERRDDFQRETLVSMQDAYVALAGQAARVYLADQEEYREVGTWGRRRLPEDIGGESSLDVGRNYNRLAARVLDDQLRELLYAFKDVCNRLDMPAMPGRLDDAARATAEAAAVEMASLTAQVDATLGVAIRQLYLSG